MRGTAQSSVRRRDGQGKVDGPGAGAATEIEQCLSAFEVDCGDKLWGYAHGQHVHSAQERFLYCPRAATGGMSHRFASFDGLFQVDPPLGQMGMVSNHLAHVGWGFTG